MNNIDLKIRLAKRLLKLGHRYFITRKLQYVAK